MGKPSLKAIDKWWSAYGNAVIMGLVRITITYKKKEKVAARMLFGQEAVWILPLDESMFTNNMLF